ncbi:hypothetical protein M427DRAFT_250143 [Gonapodya prolifera JEL478]|uniref:G-protein coupled receptors family 3 profile domain-containing protein n=1 Tax=Gonapodya prolifera (strain JEL478) TaxID=1344416 RepID=A0A138ZXC1_GONPJ|nr:hypothetical protein M427DRAFT_250143 [Gonapodya prolifera JEL478]|eukprot:KXS09150.1 hypothetical protein M427DRAFT_250143 [Gonapodya prolifera JEL478]
MLARIVQGNMTVDQSTAAACSEIDTMVFPEPITIQVYSFIGGIGFAATAVTQILCGVVILAAWKYRSHPSMINPLTSTITLVGCIVFLSSSLSLLGPRSPAACTSIYVLLGTGFSAIIGPIIMRLYGVYKVFISESSGVALPRSRLFAIALLPLLGDMVILILWIVLDPPSVVKQTSKDGARMQVCGLGRRNTDINIHLIVFIAYNWCLLVSAMVLAWKTREVFDPLIERSSHIFFACGNALFLGCVCTLVLFTTDLSPEGNFIFRTLCSIILIV